MKADIWSRAKLLAYIERVENHIEEMSLYELMDIDPGQGDIQRAFHKVAHRLHPDLYRSALSKDEHRRLTSVYAKIANAYHVLRDAEKRTKYDKELREDAAERVVTDKSAVLLEPRAKAQLRRAQAAARRGDRASAILHLKMALSIAPDSALLRGLLQKLEKASK